MTVRKNNFKSVVFLFSLVQNRENLTIVTELGDRAAQGRAFGNLGNTHYLLGNFRSAVLAHEQVQQHEISLVAPDLVYMYFVVYSHELFNASFRS